ncbi:MAG TPA: zf-HC2 domain-containing protein [Gemmatimonadaceae bacterium]|nr:zf-HC2 domain-containing protein [Gemmatimonadaceae bacterium]
MTKCMNADIRDVLPDYVHGHLDAASTAEVRAHISDCAECVTEVEMLNLVVATVPTAPAMNVSQIATALPLPTRHGFLLHRGGGATASEPPRPVATPFARRKGAWANPLVKVAATAAIVTAGGLSLIVGRDVLRPEVQVGQTAPAAVPQVAVTPVAPAITPGDVPAPAKSAPAPKAVEVASAKGLSLAGGLQDLSEEHLAALLEDIDEMDALPAAEPETMEPSVAGSGSGIDQ